MIDSAPTPATYTRVLLQATSAKKRAALLQGTGLNEDSLSDFDAIGADQQIQVFRNAQKIASDPTWALKLGQQLNVNSHGALGFAALSAPTLGDSLETLTAFARIRAPYLRFGFERLPDHYRLTVEPAFEVGDLDIAIDEIVLQIVDSLVQVVLGSMAPGVKVMLAYPPPPHAPDYAHYFSAPCEFDQAFSGMELPLSLCHVPCPLHDKESYVASLTRCRKALATIIDPADVVSRVRNLLASHFEQVAIGAKLSEAPQLESLASKLCMSPRTLIRQLAAQNSGYREILEEAQRETACTLLAQTRYTVNEIALLLDYSDGPNFGRAFRRWFGVAPGQYRRRC
ncbi:MAG: hypothetical protein DRR06_15750 [Gammaproteobacteria bacterium]|nr:MAG: hypothetical protein DRR06_15750 [Gammaproteobacteria bacterium]